MCLLISNVEISNGTYGPHYWYIITSQPGRSVHEWSYPAVEPGSSITIEEMKKKQVGGFMQKQDRFTTCFKTCGTGSFFWGWVERARSLWCQGFADREPFRIGGGSRCILKIGLTVPFKAPAVEPDLFHSNRREDGIFFLMGLYKSTSIPPFTPESGRRWPDFQAWAQAWALLLYP